MNKICTKCGNEFETKRIDAKFCSSGCRKAYSRNVTDKLSVTNTADVTDNVTDKPISVTDNSLSVTKPISVTPDSANNEVKATKVASAHYENKTVSGTHPDNETRQWLIDQFKDEGKPPDEIKSIMTAQDTYYQNQSHYFIPARMLSLRDERKN